MFSYTEFRHTSFHMPPLSFDFIGVLPLLVHKPFWVVRRRMLITIFLYINIRFPAVGYDQSSRLDPFLYYRQEFSSWPRLHWNNETPPRSFFNSFPILLSSICTVFSGPPNLQLSLIKTISQTSLQKQSQSTPVFDAKHNCCCICACSILVVHQ